MPELLFEGRTTLSRRPCLSAEDIAVGELKIAKILNIMQTTITSMPLGSSVSIVVQVTPPKEVER
ncbi:hypothetical protein [Desulfosporosinus youngiae]|uniref:Uncharacterized protein n=1 Tax=Desulfosporosinus youngiae DSM 17734 TaxID=768710 RepID=H5XZX5_9FIRM|nr:hypothetical protein [Desulfosporosinus youngiae]EHQ92171.1 hypothetical protein DesyoDRAFT_5241 [Desulfosporosinus youngiae DSM 17734]